MKNFLAIFLTTWLIVSVGAPSRAMAGADPGQPEGMFALYERNRTEGIPNYITEDFILLAYSEVLSEAVKELEEEILHPRFQALVNGIVSKLKEARGRDEFEDGAIKGALDYACALQCLLSGDDAPDAAADGTVIGEELARVRAARGVDKSGLMRQMIDYSQFKARGEYAGAASSGRYFRAMKYAGTAFFPVVESKATGVGKEDADLLTARALALARVIMEDAELKKIYLDFESRLSRLFGPSEDLTLEDYYHTSKEAPDAAMEEIRAALLKRAREQGGRPVILTSIVNRAALEPGIDARDVLTGLRFMPQRFTPDSAAMQRLVFDGVRDYKGEGAPFSAAVIEGRRIKGYPLGLELMALLGSKEAGQKLAAGDETNYEGYSAAASEATRFLTRPAGMPGEHLMLMQYWLTRGGLCQGDGSRRLNTCLAFWTCRRRASVLYAKQSYTMKGKGLDFPVQRSLAWIEPAPELYLYLQNLTKETLNHLDSDRLRKFDALLDRCRKISFREISGQPLDAADVDFLNNLDARFLSLTGGKDGPMVVDVHTEPTAGMALHEAVGRPEVVFKDLPGKKARGGLFRYYEFKHPMADRLTDEEWRAILNDPVKMKRLDMSPGSKIKVMDKSNL